MKIVKLMKNLVILAALILGIGFSTHSFAQNDRRLKNGFSICLVPGIPSSNYGYQKDIQVSSQYKSGSIWGLKMGNRWYFKPKENYGFGLMVNWFDISMAIKSTTVSGSTTGTGIADFSLLQFGPVGTYAVAKDIALDGYYNVRPTIFERVVVQDDDDNYAYAGFGFSNALGAAFRYKVLNLGIEYVFGGINTTYTNTSSSSGSSSSDTQKLSTNSFRILLGLKF
jgi:hypothetical protein